MEFREPEDSFQEAINSGRLSDDRHSSIYAGLYMYMGHQDNRALFKHIETRRYLA